MLRGQELKKGPRSRGAEGPREMRMRNCALRQSLFVFSAPAALMVLGALPDWANTTWSYVLLVLGFSLVIFVHELGHFLAAKWAGVRVERFAIGFGKELFGFSRGETRYSFNVLPLGGYVKMLGQEDFVVDKSGELKVKHDPRSFTSKSIGKRMVIISAGVIMNLLFAAIAFGAVVMVGRPQRPPVVGIVVDGSAAARAGLQTGDRITAINGRQITNFGDLSAAITLSDEGERLVLDILRDGKLVEPRPEVLPEYNESQKVRQIGVGPGMNRRVAVASMRSAVDFGDHVLQVNDELYKLVVNGEEKECGNLGEIRRAITLARGTPVEFVVKRPRNPDALTQEDLLKADLDVESDEVLVEIRAMWTPVPDDPARPGTGSLLGLIPRLTVLYTEAGKSFDAAGVMQGDIIVRLGPHAYPDYATVKRTIESNPGTALEIEVRRPNQANGDYSATLVRFCGRHREELITEAINNGIAAAGKRAEETAQAESLPESDRARLRETLSAAGTVGDVRGFLETVDVHKVGPLVPKAPFSLLGKAPPPPIDAGLAPLDENALVVSGVLDDVGGQPTPARIAQIPVGAVIQTCNGAAVDSWMSLCRSFEAAAGGEVELTYRVVDEIHSTKFKAPMCVTAALAIPPGSRIVSIDGKKTFPVSGTDGKVNELMLPDWRAIRTGLSAGIGRTVNVSYVTYDGEARSGSYVVTRDNTDPWLQRIFYTEPFICYDLLERHAVRNPIAAVGIGFRQAYDATVQTVQTIHHMLITRQVGVSKISGPVGIVRMGSRFADSGLLDLLWFLAIISANLAVINFLPMPIVDGGLFLFLVLEKIRGEPVSIKTQVATQIVGIALIATLFILVTYQDIKNWITGA